MSESKDPRRGKPIRAHRVSAVIRVGNRYVFRQVCNSVTGPSNLYGFPAHDLYSRETIEEAAVCAAAKYSFDVAPQDLITTDLTQDGVHSYVLCSCEHDDYPDEWTVKYRRGDEISIRLMTQDDALSHPWVRESNKKIIRKLLEQK